MTIPRSDRRRAKRQALSLYLQFADNRTGQPVGDLADISLDGFMLESVKPIPLDVEFLFRVDLPPDISDQAFMVFTARSRWSRRDPLDGRLHDTGFEATKIDPGDTRTLRLLFEKYGRRNIGGD
jgi:hypothetical protein